MHKEEMVYRLRSLRFLPFAASMGLISMTDGLPQIPGAQLCAPNTGKALMNYCDSDNSLSFPPATYTLVLLGQTRCNDSVPPPPQFIVAGPPPRYSALQTESKKTLFQASNFTLHTQRLLLPDKISSTRPTTTRRAPRVRRYLPARSGPPCGGARVWCRRGRRLPPLYLRYDCEKRGYERTTQAPQSDSTGSCREEARLVREHREHCREQERERERGLSRAEGGEGCMRGR
ncbi:hypothetical protein C8R45DRAFT_187084 [Mycena sanguinolenta]|nr:hypothetical protein C8R45DRAFT_187084 [Mycena sanguinolenta]